MRQGSYSEKAGELTMLLLYFGFAAAVACWTLCSGLTATTEMKLFYLLTVLVLLAAETVITFVGRKKKNLYSCGTAALILANAGASLAYRMNQVETETVDEVSHSKQYFEDVILMLIVFGLVYVTVRFTRIYQLKIVNLIIAAALPAVLFITRISGEESNGAYISFFGILIFAVVLAGYPFAAAYFLSREESRYLHGGVRSMPLNLASFLGYTFILYVGCVICNEFGLLLVVGITSTMLFYIRSRNFRTKLLYTAICGMGALLSGIMIGHIQERIYIWIHLSEITPEDPLAGKAESVLYVFRNLPRTGFWGNGLGSIPVSIYPTLNTDHAFVALMLEYSLVFATLILLIGILYVKALLAGCPADSLYDYILNLCCALIIGSIILIHIGSNLGSSITAGVGMPYASEGSAVNIMLAALTAVHCGIYERGRRHALSEEKTVYEN